MRYEGLRRKSAEFTGILTLHQQLTGVIKKLV